MERLLCAYPGVEINGQRVLLLEGLQVSWGRHENINEPWVHLEQRDPPTA